MASNLRGVVPRSSVFTAIDETGKPVFSTPPRQREERSVVLRSEAAAETLSSPIPSASPAPSELPKMTFLGEDSPTTGKVRMHSPVRAAEPAGSSSEPPLSFSYNSNREINFGTKTSSIQFTLQNTRGIPSTDLADPLEPLEIETRLNRMLSFVSIAIFKTDLGLIDCYILTNKGETITCCSFDDTIRKFTVSEGQLVVAYPRRSSIPQDMLRLMNSNLQKVCDKLQLTLEWLDEHPKVIHAPIKVTEIRIANQSNMIIT